MHSHDPNPVQQGAVRQEDGPRAGETNVPSDGEIIQAVLAGDTGRYAQLVDRYQRAAWKLAYSFLGNMQDSEEISQNSFVKAYRNLRRFKGKSKFYTWLYRIILNECKDLLRHRRRRPQTVPLDGEPEDPSLFEPADTGASPREQAGNRELAVMLTRLIRQLPEKQQTAFVLHHVQGLTIEEASRVMGCRAGTVKSHLFRATERLRSSLEPKLLAQEGPG